MNTIRFCMGLLAVSIIFTLGCSPEQPAEEIPFELSHEINQQGDLASDALLEANTRLGIVPETQDSFVDNSSVSQSSNETS